MAIAKVLIVDDSREIRDFLAESVLRPAGYDVMTAADGRSGFRLAQQHRPEIIIADLQMPGLSGLELKKALVAAGNNSPLILVTAEGSENIASQATLAGVAYYLPKPIDVAVLLSAMSQALVVERLRRERAEALAALETRVRQFETLQSMGRVLIGSLDMNKVLNRVLAAAVSLTNADGGRLFLLDERTAQLTLRASRGPAGTATLLSVEPADDLLAAQVIRSNQPLNYHPSPTSTLPPGAPVHPALYVPLSQGDRMLGALAVDSRLHLKPFADSDLGPVATLADYASIAVVNAQLFAQVQMVAITDSLTGLFNRRYLMVVGEQEFQRSRRFERPLSAIMLDIDHFKLINDTHGHATGDQVLAEVGRRLHSGVRNIDIAGRYGGEEFLLLLPETALPGTGLLAERLRRGMAATPIATLVGPLTITMSLGVATTQPGVADVATLIANADAALYSAKQAGRNRVAAFGLPVS